MARCRSDIEVWVVPAFGHRPVGSITTTEIDEWMARIDRAPTTRRKILRQLSAMLELARRDRAITVNPAADADRPSGDVLRQGVALSDVELSGVLDAAEHGDPDTAAAVWLMGRAGPAHR